MARERDYRAEYQRRKQRARELGYRNPYQVRKAIKLGELLSPRQSRSGQYEPTRRKSARRAESATWSRRHSQSARSAFNPEAAEAKGIPYDDYVEAYHNAFLAPRGEGSHDAYMEDLRFYLVDMMEYVDESEWDESYDDNDN